jgi:predicted SnoaL-like aldol condensation-catalyzing enzyme
MAKTTPEQNKAIVLKAFDTLFNKRDDAAAERFWSPTHIQHSAHIAPGREGRFNLVRSAPITLGYENQLIVAKGDCVIAHGRLSGNGRPAPWIAADIVRFEGGLLAEHSAAFPCLASTSLHRYSTCTQLSPKHRLEAS